MTTAIIHTVTTVAALTAVNESALVDGDQIEVAGYISAGDGGGGRFTARYQAGLTADGGMVFDHDTNADWQFQRQFDGGAIRVKWFGASGDGSTDDLPAVQAAADAVAQWKTVTLQTVASGHITGGGELKFDQTEEGYKLSGPIKVPSKVTMRGPARLIGTSGQNICDFNFAGSTTHQGVIISDLDFIGGAIAIDTQTQSISIPLTVEKCSFINQTVAGVKLGANGFNITITKCQFSGINGHGVWSAGAAADGLEIKNCVFIYNTGGYDIYVQNNNVVRIINNAFVGNQRTPIADMANVYFDTATSNLTGGHSIISGNKFGSEGRTGGNCIVFAGTAGAIHGLTITDNLLHFLSGTTNVAIKFGVKHLYGCKIENNTLNFCALMDAANVPANGFTAKNVIRSNHAVSITGGSVKERLPGQWEQSDSMEPPQNKKINIIKYSRLIDDAAFLYSNHITGFLTSTDENGVANNASSFLATATNNLIRVVSVDTNNQQMYYTFSIWLKLNAASSITIRLQRTTQYGFNEIFAVGTAWQRIVIPFHQTYYTAGLPYVLEIVIPNGATLTVGNICVNPGNDAGDLRRFNSVIEYAGLGLRGPAAPTMGAFALGETVINTVATEGTAAGWICTTAGTPGTFSPFAIVGAARSAFLANLGQTIGGTPSQTEVQAISDKVDALLDALKTAKLMAPS